MRDDSADKNTYCLCTGPGFSSEHPHGGLEPFVTRVPGDHMPLLTSEQLCCWSRFSVEN